MLRRVVANSRASRDSDSALPRRHQQADMFQERESFQTFYPLLPADLYVHGARIAHLAEPGQDHQRLPNHPAQDVVAGEIGVPPPRDEIVAVDWIA